MALARGERQITFASGRRVGKTTMMAWLSMWFEMTRADAKTVVTAPASSQLMDAYAPEFRKWVNRLPEGLNERWNVRAERFDYRLMDKQPFENFITLRTARKDSPESVKGINATHNLTLGDEAAGIDDIVLVSLSGSMGGDGSHIVLTGNPNRNTGFFYDTHHTSVGWHRIQVSSEDEPTVSRQWISEMETKYGRASNAFRIHVLGEFPLADDNTVIARELIESAVERDILRDPKSHKVWGLDVARFGDDASVLVERRGNHVYAPKSWRNLDTMQLAGRIKQEWDLLAPQDKPVLILVDVIGYGAGVVDRLKEFDLPVYGVNVSESPAIGDHYAKLKDELWDKMRAWFETRAVRIPRDTHLIEQLAVVQKDYTPSGKMKVESKKELKKRGQSSPDFADALALTFARDAGTALHGGIGWKGSIKRRIKGVV